VSAIRGAARPRRAHAPPESSGGGFVRSVALLRDRVPSFKKYPFSIPAVRRDGYLCRLFEDLPEDTP